MTGWGSAETQGFVAGPPKAVTTIDVQQIKAQGAAEERARIVAWLRGYHGHADGEWARAARWFADRLAEEA